MEAVEVRDSEKEEKVMIKLSIAEEEVEEGVEVRREKQVSLMEREDDQEPIKERSEVRWKYGRGRMRLPVDVPQSSWPPVAVASAGDAHERCDDDEG
nr:hypothetical protein CFP56_02978 [Quercus suber]